MSLSDLFHLALPSKSIHVAENGKNLIFNGWVIFHLIFHFIHTHTNHIFFIHSSVDGHLGCFHTLAIVNKAAMVFRASKVALVVKNPPANAGNIRDLGLIPGSGRSPGGGNNNPLQYSSWRIPWTEEPGGLWSIGSQRIRHNWGNLTHTHEHWGTGMFSN